MDTRDVLAIMAAIIYAQHKHVPDADDEDVYCLEDAAMDAALLLNEVVKAHRQCPTHTY